MGYEMSNDFHERTNIMAVAQFIGQWAWVIAPWFWVIMDDKSFFESLTTHKKHFDTLLARANANNARLKYVAQLENGVAKVGLQEIPEGHDFYSLEGSDNIILFYTNRYVNQPLIVKGAGAGAEVTASGIFADIIRIGKR